MLHQSHYAPNGASRDTPSPKMRFRASYAKRRKPPEARRAKGGAPARTCSALCTSSPMLSSTFVALGFTKIDPGQRRQEKYGGNYRIACRCSTDPVVDTVIPKTHIMRYGCKKAIPAANTKIQENLMRAAKNGYS
jgi:hypothetical protein